MPLSRSHGVGRWLVFAAWVLIALMFGETRVHAMDSLAADNPKYLRIKAVYDSVARAFGEGRIPPRLMVVPLGSQNRNSVAWSDPGTEGAIGLEADSAPMQEGYIAIEERAYDVLAPLGDFRDDGLAFLLGHELTHYFMRHGWVGDFGNSFASLDVGRKMIKAASIEETIKRETEADYFGGFYGYLAGYDTLGIAPHALDLIYAGYGLSERLPNYPSRSDRKTIAEHADLNLRKMVPVFDAATKLLLLERYADSARLFEQLTHNFPSREMFNNLGVAYALQALSLNPPGQRRLAYPFEIDAETRLKGKGLRAKGAPDHSAEERRRLLNQAADAFEKAMQRDRAYAAACVNLAAATSLLGDHDTAVVLANKGIELGRKANEMVSVGNGLVVRGIAYAGLGNKERALVDFAGARNLNSSVAAVNLAILQEEGAKPIAAPAEGEVASKLVERVGGIACRDPFAKDKETTTFSLQGLAGARTIAVHARQYDHWEDAVIVSGARMERLLTTRKGYQGETARGISVGSSRGDVMAKYGTPSREVTARQGTYLLYRKGEIIFSLDQREKVAGWTVFATR